MLEKKITVPEENQQKEICGIVMPISAIDGCNEGHWNDVMEIINDCIEEAGFEPNIVSNADEVGVIQKRIIQNLYDNPIVVCDVSGKNPNVMFELGLRLAFDKPTIIIKDDKTSYSFDTSPIEHLEYPRDLRFNKIEEFKSKLIEKILKTHEKSIEDPHFSTFLKHFGEFKVAKIDKKEVSQQEFIMDEIKSLRGLIVQTNKNRNNTKNELYGDSDEFKDNNSKNISVCCGGASLAEIKTAIPKILEITGVINVEINTISANHHHVKISTNKLADRTSLRTEVRRLTKTSAKRTSR